MSVSSKLKSLRLKAQAEVVFRLIRHHVKPNHDFDVSKVTERPNYSLLDHWAAHPEKESYASMRPAGVPLNDAEKPIDVFYIYPTLCFSQNHWNAPLDYVRTNEMIDQSIMPGQVSVYNEHARIFSPRYRQATFYSFLEASDNSHQAFDLAYQDIEQAFHFYIRHLNEGRPFIIASHSQGSLHGIRLLEEQIDSSPYYDQFIAAYLIGMHIPKDKIGRTLHQIKAAESATDTGCIITYDTYGMNGGPQSDRDNVQHYYPDTREWEYRRDKAVMGINPMNWTTGTELAGESLHKGGVRMKFTKESNFDMKNLFSEEAAGIQIQSLSAPISGEVSAQLDSKGVLHISTPKHQAFREGLLPNENYHIHDISLFYMNLRENVADRVKSYFANQA